MDTRIREDDAIGFVETGSLVAAIEAADAMVKAALVRVTSARKIGGGLVCVTAHGDLASCQAAVLAGQAAAERVGSFLQANVIARPDADTNSIWTEHMPAMTLRKATRKAARKSACARAANSDAPEAATAGKPASRAGRRRKTKE